MIEKIKVKAKQIIEEDSQLLISSVAILATGIVCYNMGLSDAVRTDKLDYTLTDKAGNVVKTIYVRQITKK